MFLTLVFLAELVAGVSGFIFRHEVRNWHTINNTPPNHLATTQTNPNVHVLQIKAIIYKAYGEAEKNYNMNDTRSIAVDTIQRTVSTSQIQAILYF